MQEVLTFKNDQFGQVRTVNHNNEIWFVLLDVCKALGINNVTDTQRRLDFDERLRLDLSRNHKAWFVNESGLYAVILRSDKPNAKPFRKWVTSEVL